MIAQGEWDLSQAPFALFLVYSIERLGCFWCCRENEALRLRVSNVVKEGFSLSNSLWDLFFPNQPKECYITKGWYVGFPPSHIPFIDVPCLAQKPPLFMWKIFRSQKTSSLGNCVQKFSMGKVILFDSPGCEHNFSYCSSWLALCDQLFY